MSRHCLGSCSILLNTPSGLIIGNEIWSSVLMPNDQIGSSLDTSLRVAGLMLSVAMNTVTTMMIAYKLWYIAVGGISGSP